MAVYFEPQRRPWYMGLVEMGLGEAMKGMFERSAQARADDQFRRQMAAASADLADPNGKFCYLDGRQGGVTPQNYLKALGEFSADNAELGAGLIRSAYGDALKTYTDLNRGDQIKGRMGDAPDLGDARGWSGYLTNAGVYGGNDLARTLGEQVQHATPHYRFDQMDLGNQRYQVALDPKTGKASPVFGGAVAVSPDQASRAAAQHDSAAAQRYSADASRYASDRGLRLAKYETTHGTTAQSKDLYRRAGQAVVELSKFAHQTGRELTPQVFDDLVRPYAQSPEEVDQLKRLVLQAQVGTETDEVGGVRYYQNPLNPDADEDYEGLSEKQREYCEKQGRKMGLTGVAYYRKFFGAPEGGH